MLRSVTMRAVGVVAVTAMAVCGCERSTDRVSTSSSSSASPSSSQSSSSARESFDSFPKEGLAQPEGMVSVPSPEGTTRTGEGQVAVGRIPLTPAPGWRTVDQAEGFLILAKEKPNPEFMAVQDFKLDSGSSAIDSVQTIFERTGQKFEWSSVQAEKPTDLGLTGKRFEESAGIQYTAENKDDQGTFETFGAVIVLLDPKTGDAGLIHYFALSPKALQVNDKDVQAMISSMLN